MSSSRFTTGVQRLRLFWSLLTTGERRRLALLFAMMVFGVALEALSVSLVIPAVALLADPGYLAGIRFVEPVIEALGNPTRERLLLFGMGALVAVYLLKNLFLGFLVWHQNGFAYRLDARLARRLLALYLAQPWTFHLQRNSAQLVNNLTLQVTTFTVYGVAAGLILVAEVLVLLGLATLLLAIEPVGTLLVGALVLISSATFSWLTRHRIATWAVARQRHEDLAIQRVQEALGAARDVIVLGRAGSFVDRFDWHNSRRAAIGRRQDSVQLFPRLGLELLAVGALAGLTFFYIAAGRPIHAVLPTLGVFAAVAFRLLPSANRILYNLHQVRFAFPAIDRLSADLSQLPPGRSDEAPQLELRESLELADVAYSYPGAGRPTLQGVSLRVERGESVGIIGASGSGKSTLIDLLLGLLTPESGALLVDGHDVTADPRGWQRRIGYVPQFIYVADDTIRRNVALGVPDEEIDEERVLRALHAANLDQFVAALPLGLDTMLGERGTRVSGGELQRIGIARALYHEPAVLILDEATSALDVGTERAILNTVEALHGEKTIVIATHRETALEHCDRVFSVERGRVVELPAAHRPTHGDASA